MDSTRTRRQRMYWLHALEPTHVGAGRGAGFIDLPIMREVITNWPFVPGSAVKGVWADSHGADEASRQSNDKHRLAFGLSSREGGSNTENAGCLQVTDARLVCFPVKSLYGTFAWTTCPMALRRLARDLVTCNGSESLPEQIDLPAPTDPEQNALSALVPDNPTSKLTTGRADAEQPNLFLGELDFRASPCTNSRQWAEFIAKNVFSEDKWQELFKEHFVVVADDVFTFLTEFASQVDARVKINQGTKTVATGQLWYEESLPAETILAGYVWCDRIFGNNPNGVTEDELLKNYCSGRSQLQIGGKATVGRGLVEIVFQTDNSEGTGTTDASGTESTEETSESGEN